MDNLYIKKAQKYKYKYFKLKNDFAGGMFRPPTQESISKTIIAQKQDSRPIGILPPESKTVIPQQPEKQASRPIGILPPESKTVIANYIPIKTLSASEVPERLELLRKSQLYALNPVALPITQSSPLTPIPTKDQVLYDLEQKFIREQLQLIQEELDIQKFLSSLTAEKLSRYRTGGTPVPSFQTKLYNLQEAFQQKMAKINIDYKNNISI